MVVRKEVDLGGGKVLRIETGKMAKQADGAAVVGLAETMVLATVVARKDDPVPGQDFIPLQVEFREKYSAAGKFPVVLSSVRVVLAKKKFFQRG